jgi:drug/metabolite transporter (DMT)-like permease
VAVHDPFPIVLAPMPGPKRFLPHLLLIALIVIWSASFVVSKVAQRQLEPFALVAVRFWLAALCVLPFLRGCVAAQLRTALGPGLAAGTALGCGYLLQMKGLTETSASMSGLLAGLIVPLVALGGFVFLRARLGALGIGGLLLAIAGMVAICWPRSASGSGPQDSLRGILLQVGSSASYAAHVLLLSRFGRQMPAAAFTLLQLVLVAVAGTVATLVTGDFAVAANGSIDWNGELLAALAYLGILSTAVAIGVQGMVQPRIPPTHVALLFTLQPLFAAVFGWALQGDRLDGGQLIGGAMIVLGVVVTSRDR